tara:strand:+ start:3997 stop:4410 length:414 start_codon:yes stop_codon:yes gene_type:complete
MAARNETERLLTAMAADASSTVTNVTLDDTNISTSATNSDRAAGQYGSIYMTGNAAAATCAVSGKVFVSIHIITAAVFGTLTAETAALHINTANASTDIDTDAGTNLSSVSIPAGTTLFGRWTTIDLASGSCIAYIG